jgi:hypothetical protein
MLKEKRAIILVCLVISLMLIASLAGATEFRYAAFAERQEDLASPAHEKSQAQPITKVKPTKKIVKCKPLATAQEAAMLEAAPVGCYLPQSAPRGWKLDAQAMFARTRGKVRYLLGNYGYNYYSNPDADLNSALGLPEHQVIGTYSAAYRFTPQWSLRYSVMPLSLEGSGSGNSFTFGTTLISSGTNTKAKWERLTQRIGIVYDPIRTYNSRVSVFGDYMRVDDKVSVIQLGCCGSTMNNEFNMAVAGLEFEKCLKNTRFMNTLSLECKAGVAFLDDAVGSDLSTGLKFSIPMNNGRWGYLSGGYRYVSLNRKYSDARLTDTTMDGGYLQMGLIF